MDIDIERALDDAFARATTRAGATVAALVALTQLVSAVGIDTEQAFLQRRLFEQLALLFDTSVSELVAETNVEFARGPLALPGSVPHWYGSLLLFLGSILGIVASLVALRTFTGDRKTTVDRSAFRRLGVATLNALVGSIVFTFAVGTGLFLLLLPGIFLLVSLYFYTAFIAIEDQNFVEAFRSSWALTKGRRLAAFVFLVLVYVVNIVASALTTVVTIVFDGLATTGGTGAFQLGGTASPVARLLSIGIHSLGALFVLALTAVVFDQFRDLQVATDDDFDGIDEDLLP
ncbi:hypothetical protein [Haloarchaeobius sp. HRN-SO-5]|uniref:hypothetical protein n=1 Tax=Haloarchaeobius sp. HRN-SO-5 TaxID=3446118 RepID=UPI003EC12EDA